MVALGEWRLYIGVDPVVAVASSDAEVVQRSARLAVALVVGRDDGFTEFFRSTERPLRRALVAAYGAQVGREAAAEALAYGWEHWEKLHAMTNPAGYLYRVGQTWARRHFMSRRRLLGGAPFPPVEAAGVPWIEPGLPKALASLTARQRQAVVLVHGLGLSRPEVASLIGLSPSSVQNHAERGLAKLRRALGAT